MSKPKAYTTVPHGVQAMRLDDTNGPDVARWCGGLYEENVSPRDPTDVARWVIIPSFGTTKPKASVGDYVVREEATGRFEVWPAKEFESKYHEIGVR